ncbi:MAG: F0F1 ATP synthase subunit epsilon [bacterium]|nr:F0F1 ATP synthase subunit epsilon [bacterium]
MSSLWVKVVTKDRLVLEEEADFVVAPGELGELGILPNHTPLLSTLKIGELRIKKDGQTVYLAISGGFMEVFKNRIAILAETAERAEEIDIDRAKRTKEWAEAEIKRHHKGEEEFLRMEGIIKRALNRLRIAEKRGQNKEKR